MKQKHKLPFQAQITTTLLATTMCNAMKLVTGNAGKAFAAFAIISLGIVFSLEKSLGV